MKLLSAFVILILFSFTSYGQDTIYLKRDTFILAKVTRVEQTVIWYKKFDFLDGPEYKLSTREIKVIVYNNGETEEYNVGLQGLKDFDSTFNNLISVNIGSSYIGNFGISYRRYIFHKKASIKIPINYSQQPFAPLFLTGLDLSIIPTGVKRNTYNVGIGARYGLTQINYGNFSPYSKNFWGLYLNNGWTLILNNHFSFSAQIGLGFKEIEGNNSLVFNAIGELNIGYRFNIKN